MVWYGVAVAVAGEVCPGVVINEFLADPPSSDAGLEWVELASCAAEPVDVGGWRLASGTSRYELSDPLPAGTVIPPGGHLVVGQEGGGAEVDLVVAGWSLGNASSSADAIQLRDAEGRAVDTVVYGEPNADGWIDDGGAIAVSLAPAPPAGGTVGRLPDAADTDRSGADFAALGWASPGAPNDGPAPDCGGPGSGLVINELLPDPDGADEGGEWVELFHGGEAPIDLAGWRLESGTTGWVARFTWEGGVVVPGERRLVGGARVAGIDVEADPALGNAGTSADGVRIVDCAGAPADTVVYGPANPDGFADDGGAIAVSLAPGPGTGRALARRTDGRDTDRCGEDFVVTDAPTPGAPNPDAAVGACDEGPGLVVNEVMPDPAGADAGAEWIELYNPLDREVSLAGWGLGVAGSAERIEWVSIPAGAIPARGFAVLGGAGVPGAAVVLDLALGNGTETDGIQLVDCGGAVVDTVLYGEAPNADRLIDDRGEVPRAPYGDPRDGASLARAQDGRDTDRPEDWRVSHRPTPGASNTGSPIAGGLPRAGCAGGGDPPGCAAPPGSGTTAFLGGAPGSVAAGAGLALAAVRRRARPTCSRPPGTPPRPPRRGAPSGRAWSRCSPGCAGSER